MLKRWIASCLTIVATLVLFAGSASASDLQEGAKVFSQNCAACHANGANLVNGAKTLKKDALEKYDVYSEEKIIYQVTNGKMAMPAFKGRLSDDQIASVAAYVLDRADNGWQ